MPCAVIHGDKLVIGGVAGNGPGDTAVAVYDLRKGVLWGRATVAEEFDRDDHKSPVLYPRPDGSLLTVCIPINR